MDGAEFVNQVGEHCRLGDTEFLDTRHGTSSIYFSDVLVTSAHHAEALPLTLLSAIFLHYFARGCFIDSC